MTRIVSKLQPFSPCHAAGPLLTSGLRINSLSCRSPPHPPSASPTRWAAACWPVKCTHPPPTEAHITYSAAIVMRHVNPSGTGPYQPYKQIIAPLEVMLAHQYQWACGGEKEWDNKIMNIQKRHRGRDPTGDQINCSTPTWNACWWMTVIVRVLNIYVRVYKYMHTYINTWVHAYMNTRIHSCKCSLN